MKLVFESNKDETYFRTRLALLIKPVVILMTETENSVGFARLDGEKYGKNSSLISMEGDSYSQGITINASEIAEFTNKSENIAECNKLSNILNGRLLMTLPIDKDAKKVAICCECGFKDELFEDKCPKCKSPYVV